MIKQYVIQRGGSAFWTGHDWTGAVGEALRMTMGEGVDVLRRLAAGSPATLNLIKDYGTTTQCVLCTA